MTSWSGRTSLTAIAAAAVSLQAFGAVGADAQAGPAVAVDAGLGFGGGGTTGEYRPISLQVGGDLLAVLRVTSTPRGAVVSGVGLGFQVPAGGLEMNCRVNASGECIPWYPSFRLISGLVGVQNARGTGRLLTGPVRLRGDLGGSATGWHLRADASSGNPLAFVIWARAVLVPRYRDDRFQLFAVGVGVGMR